MMARYMQLLTNDGDIFVVELESEEGLEEVGTEKIIQKKQEEFDQAMKVVMLGVTSLQKSVKALGEELAPDEVSWEFGVKFDAEVGAVITKYSMGGNFNVKLTWKSK